MAEPLQNSTPLPEHVGKDVLLYDGVCAFCDFSVQFILPRDSKGLFHFASLQSDFARQMLTKYGHDPNELDTFYVIVGYGTAGEHLLNRSAAALYVLSRLDGICRWCSVFKIVPRALADAGYNLIARNRYSVLGKHDTCTIAQPGFAGRFIDSGK
jgi:predicted DCC family thiol-disulfide oxidoreductase YuxK